MDLITDLSKVSVDNDTRICSFDIKNMYSNIPTLDLINIVADMNNKCNILNVLAK
jgi:hypothetical protein